MTACINSIWDEFSKPLKCFIKKRIPQEQDSEDVLQEVFIKIYNNIDKLTDNKKIYSWIYTITRNTIIDYYRKKNNSRTIELLEDIEKEENEEFTITNEIVLCLKGMIDSLPEIYKQAIFLTEFENITQKELATKMSISLSCAKSRVQRGRKMLEEMLLSCCNFEFDRLGNIIDYTHKKTDCKYC